jgi:hypothetical protein
VKLRGYPVKLRGHPVKSAKAASAGGIDKRYLYHSLVDSIRKKPMSVPVFLKKNGDTVF